MARYSLSFANKVMIAVADATPMTSNGYGCFLLGGNATMQMKVNEVSASGESAASNPTTMTFGRDSTIAITPTAVNVYNAVMDATNQAPSTIALFGGGGATNPSRSATTGHLLHTTLNTYGGIYRWQARQGEEISTLGNGTSFGELSLSSFNGTGQISGHVLYELV